jgi:putative drug exporter of the RND superfamily
VMPDARRSDDSERASLFERLAGWSYRHRWLAVAVWVVVLAGVTVGAQAAGDAYHNDFSLPGTQSQQALDTLKAHGSSEAGSTIQVVLADDEGLTVPRDRVGAMLSELRGLPSVVSVSDPYTTPGSISPDGRVGYATVTLNGTSEDVPVDDTRRIMDTAQRAEGGGLQVEVGGDTVRAVQEGGGGPAEGVGLLAALVVLVFLFGSLLAASLPIVIAIFAVGSAFSLIVLASHVTTVADYTPPLMLLVGLGVGIDYALLIFSRYRTELVAGAERQQATRIALDTAGRTVFFAGCTVIVALLGLIVLGLGSLQGVAVAVALTVLVTMIASLTLLPSLLGIMGKRIERGVRKKAAKAKAPEGTWWRGWSDKVQRRPWLAALVPVVALAALSIPALSMRLGFADAGNDAPSTTSRQAYDLLARGFGPGVNGPLLVVVDGDAQAGATVQQALAGTEGVAGTTPPIPSSDGRSATVIVFPTSAPQDEETTELVSRLREDVLPPLAAQTNTQILVGGTTAAVVDFADAVSDRLPIFVAVVIGLSMLLLLVVFRSILIPIKAAVLNLLTVFASLGVIVLVFQNGAFGIEPGPIEAFVPVLIFAIVFGLSMDYEVFLLSRMHEHWERHHDAPAAIREGMGTTGRVVTAAGAIMILVFSAFLLDPGRMLKQFGLGLASAILIDAFIIRSLIVPAVMQLFGARAWWLPRWISRWLPHIALEGRSRSAETADRPAAEPVTTPN